MNTDRTILGHHQRGGEVLPGSACIADLTQEIERLQAKVDAYRDAVEHMDTKMTPLSVEGSDFVEMYQVMAGPWHRLLGLARS